MAFQFNNTLDLPPVPKPDVSPIEEYLEKFPNLRPEVLSDSTENFAADEVAVLQTVTAGIPSYLKNVAEFETEFAFELPMGYVDEAGQMHRKGVMRLAHTADEIEPMADVRVQSNPAYATVIILSRVIFIAG